MSQENLMISLYKCNVNEKTEGFRVYNLLEHKLIRHFGRQYGSN